MRWKTQSVIRSEQDVRAWPLQLSVTVPALGNMPSSPCFNVKEPHLGLHVTKQAGGLFLGSLPIALVHTALLFALTPVVAVLHGPSGFSQPAIMVFALLEAPAADIAKADSSKTSVDRLTANPSLPKSAMS
jgi:hypothetical protein